jgi:hypothetical protein
LITAFRDVASEKPWVVLAEHELTRPGEGSIPDDVRWAAVRQALERARTLTAENKAAEGDKIYQALEELYRDDPSARSILEEVRNARKKPGD